MTKEEFKEKLEENIYFTLRGCEEKGTIEIPRTILNFIRNIAGTCTDPNETEDFFKNPRAMFVALDLIYECLEDIT